MKLIDAGLLELPIKVPVRSRHSLGERGDLFVNLLPLKLTAIGDKSFLDHGLHR